MPEFASPYLLLLLLPLAAGLVFRWRSRTAAIAVSSVSHFQGKPKAGHGHPRRVLIVLELVSAATFVLALARPQLNTEIVPTTRVGSDIMLVLDYSNSMDAFDPDPDLNEFRIEDAIADGTLVDRLAVAKEQIAQFVERRNGDRVGLVIFGRDAYVVCPPTLDHDYLQAQVHQLTNDLLRSSERATNIAGGIAAAVDTLASQEEVTDDVYAPDAAQTIVLITDGSNSVRDGKYTPLGAARAAAEEDITIYTVGIGSDDPYAPGHLGGANASGLQLDERTLQRIADRTGGRYFRAADDAGFEDVMHTIDQLETVSRMHPALIYHRDLFPYLVLAGLVALMISTILRSTLLLTIS